MMEKVWKKEAVTDAVNALLGAFLFLSPWLFGFASDPAASWSAWVGGVAIAGFAVAALAAFAEWQEWMALLAGIAVAAAPWLIGFSADALAAKLHVIVGLIVAVVAGVRLWLWYGSPPHVTA
jgi:SPW repeat